MTWYDKMLWTIFIKIGATYFDTVDVERSSDGVSVIGVNFFNKGERNERGEGDSSKETKG